MLPAVHASWLLVCLPLATGSEGALPSPCDLASSIKLPSRTGRWFNWSSQSRSLQNLIKMRLRLLSCRCCSSTPRDAVHCEGRLTASLPTSSCSL